jgi:hypothetical protein
MRRAMLWLALILSAAVLLPAGPRAEKVDIVNGIGLIDYTRKPDFKVGDWVRYRIQARSLLGAKDDYMVTVLIAGEETFWGEDGFWVETWTEPINSAPKTIATLMSYGIFSESLSIPRMQLYMRKSINEVSEQGVPVQILSRRPPASLKSRKPFDDTIAWDVDTLGRDTVMVPRGTFECAKVRTRQGKGTQADRGDSTIYTEVRDNRVAYISREVPITSLVREEIENSMQRRTWQIGRSKEAPPLHYMDRSTGEARLVDYGSGLSARLLPPAMQKDLRQREAARTPPEKKPATAPRRATTKKSG